MSKQKLPALCNLIPPPEIIYELPYAFPCGIVLFCHVNRPKIATSSFVWWGECGWHVWSNSLETERQKDRHWRYIDNKKPLAAALATQLVNFNIPRHVMTVFSKTSEIT
jgi:hypothetical protein